MSVKKHIKFAAPYRSATFNDRSDLVMGLNGVLSGGETSDSGGIATIQPVIFVQNGLIVEIDTSTNATIPAGLTAPYYIAIAVSSSVEVLSEVITPTFVKSPEDITSDTVLIAKFDGQEWTQEPKVSIFEVIEEIERRTDELKLNGISRGLEVTVNGPDLDVAPGSLIDQQGQIYTTRETRTLTPTADDVDGLDRIDEIIYRRPDDGSGRVGQIKYVTGQTFDATDTVSVLHETQIGDTSKVNEASKVIVDPSNNKSFLFYKEDYADRAVIRMATADDDMSSTAAAVTVSSAGIDKFDVVFNPSGTIELVYTKGTDLFYKRLDQSGADLVSELNIHAAGLTVTNPKVVTVNSGTTFFIHVVYELEVSGSEHDLYYVRLSSAGAVETTAAVLVDLSDILTNPSLAKDEDDSKIFLAFENQTSTEVFLRTYDANSAGGATPPNQIGTPLQLTDDTFRLSTTTVLASGGASKPVVKRSDNKTTFVFWLQDKGGSLTGIGVWSRRYIDDEAIAHKAIVQDLTSAGEDIVDFDVDIDGMNTAHFLLRESSLGKKATLNLETTAAGLTGTVVSSDPATIGTKLNAKGSLVQTWSFASAGFTNNGSTKTPQQYGTGFIGATAIAANEIVFLQTDIDALPATPTAGDQVVVTGSASNDGTHDFLSFRQFTESATPYFAITSTTTFTSEGTGGSGQFQVQTGTDTRFAKTNAGVSDNMRDFFVTPTDIHISHYRTSDDQISMSGPALEETRTIRRLYEFIHACVGGTGTVTWQVTGTDELAFSSPISVRFFNRRASYTISAIPAGIAIPDGSVAFVEVPDEDTSAVLPLKIVEFGEGLLNREGRKSIPLFWNIGGDLFSKFAPFRLSSEPQEIVLGQGLTSQFIAWVGSGDTVPDPAAHAYGGTGPLLAADSHESAIGKLATDGVGITNRTNQDRNIHLIEGGTWTWVLATTTLSFTVDAFVQVPGLADVRNTIDQAAESPITLASDGDIAYVDINRDTGAASDRTVTVVAVGSYVDANNRVVIARRVGDEVIVGNGTIKLKDGESAELDRSPGAGVAAGGGASVQPASEFQLAILDSFDVAPADSDSKVDASNTTGSYSTVNDLYELSCDKSVTFTTTGTSYTISSAPSFTVAAGDIIWDNAQATWRRVASIATATTGTLDVAFPVDLSSSAGMVSQTVTTKDLVNVGDAAEKTRPRDFCPSTTVPVIHIDYQDSLAVGDTVADFNDDARIVVSAANDDTQAASGLPTSDLFFDIFTRPNGKEQIENYSLAEVAGDERLFLTFFCNPNNASVTTQANAIKYLVSFYGETAVTNGGFLDTAFCMTDGSGTPVNCSNPVIAAGVTEIELDFHFITGIELGRPDGDLEVFLEGKAIPRKFTGVVGANWEEVSGSTRKIRLDSDYSGVALSVHVRRRQGQFNAEGPRDELRQNTKSATFTADTDVDVYFLDASGGDFTANLPTAAGIQGKTFYFKRTDSSSNSVLVDGFGTETIDGSLTYDLRGNDAVKITSDGSNWEIISRKRTPALAIYTSAGGDAYTADTNFIHATKVVDTHNAYSTGTGDFTCPEAGNYRVTISFASNGTATTYIAKNGTNQIFIESAAANENHTGASIIDCAAGDTLSARADASVTRSSGATSHRVMFEKVE